MVGFGRFLWGVIEVEDALDGRYDDQHDGRRGKLRECAHLFVCPVDSVKRSTWRCVLQAVAQPLASSPHAHGMDKGLWSL